MGLITEGADGTITVNFPDGESLTGTIHDLNDTLGDLVDVLHEIGDIPDPFDKVAASGQRLAGLDFSNLDHLKGLHLDGFGGNTEAFRRAFGDGGGTPGPGGPNVAPNARSYPGPDPADALRNPGGIGAQARLQVAQLERRVTFVLAADDQATPVIQDVSRFHKAQDGSIATLVARGDTADAVGKIGEAASAFRASDGKSATLLALGDNAGAIGSIGEAAAAHAGIDGKSATLLALGDNASAVGAAAVAGASFDGINGKSSLLFANGDSSGAEIAAAVGAAAIYGVDGVTANLYVEGNDNYSGVIAAAGAYAGAVLATSYIDIVTREYKQSFNFSNGGVVPGYANGGVPAAANGMVMVGEAGPELVRLPGGSQVVPSPASQAIARQMRGESGPTYVINMYGTYVGNEDFAGAIYDGLAQAAAMQAASMGGI